MPPTQQTASTDLKWTTNYFWLFLLIHTLLWTIGPALIRPSLPHDTLEGITWGLQWQLGYSKHPFLTAWLCAGITQFFNTVGWPVYLLAQLAVSATFIAVWQLAKHFIPPIHALIAALLLEGILFYNINSFNLTPDTLQSPLWAFLCLFFYRALQTQKIRYWICTGLFAALCLCTKYQVILLITPMLLFCLLNQKARTSFSKPGIYIGIISFLILITPHLIWLYHHHFITLNYAETVSAEYTEHKTLIDHLIQPTRFLINNIIDVVCLVLLLWPFYTRDKIKLKLDTFKWQFLFLICYGPLIFSLILCFIYGDYFPPRWATPYFFGFGIISLAYLKPVISRKKLYQFTVTLTVFSILIFGIRMSSLSLYPRLKSDAFLPNQQIASSIANLWHKKYHSKLRYIAGSNYLVALVTPYLKDRPKPFLSWDKQDSPWINENELRKHGGIFIWDEGHNYTWDQDSRTHFQIPDSVLHRFPELKILPNFVFHRVSDNHPIIIGVAVLPPQS